jgi:hypothetical protein
MKIIHKNSPKAGLTEHLPPLVAQTLIASGFAELCSMPERGSAGWLAARKEQAATVTAPGPHDVVPSAPDGIEWGVKTTASGKVMVLKRIDGQLFFLDGPPADAPAGIRQQWLAATAANPEANAVALAAAKAAQDEQTRKDKWAGQRTVRTALFGSKPL